MHYSNDSKPTLNQHALLKGINRHTFTQLTVCVQNFNISHDHHAYQTTELELAQKNVQAIETTACSAILNSLRLQYTT